MRDLGLINQDLTACMLLLNEQHENVYIHENVNATHK